MTYDTTTLADLANQRIDIDLRIEQLQAERDRINQAIRDHTDGPDSYAAGNLTIRIQTNHRFDQHKAQQAIPAGLLPLVTTEKTTTTIDRKKVEVLAPTYLEACTVEYDHKVMIS